MTNASELLEGTTPGPWEYTPTVAFHDRPDLPCVVDRHRLVVAQFWDDGHSEDECEANAKLAAAAPDLARQVTQLEAQLAEVREALQRTDDHLRSFVECHTNDATTETWAIFHCNQALLTQSKEPKA